MFLYSLLEVSEKATNVVKWISVGAVVLLLAVIALIGFGGKKRYDAKRIAFAGVCVAMSFVLALIKFKPVQYGGSITLASFVPVLVYAYVYGPTSGFMVGLIHGLLNFIESPYILTPVTFILDYLLAFASIGIMGFFGKLPRKEKSALPVVLGSVAVFTARFIFHLVSGAIFFMQDAVWVSLPSWAMGNAFVYSLIYQCVYVPADCLIATLVLFALAKTGVLDKLAKIMRQKKSSAQ
ncbi:MAG: energy-coupled thiamine transporter ThiT [Clostridia bacterium]|nr:energy-coupled thiamine transporter ThiT [Clostridia bacterium]